MRRPSSIASTSPLAHLFSDAPKKSFQALVNLPPSSQVDLESLPIAALKKLGEQILNLWAKAVADLPEDLDKKVSIAHKQGSKPASLEELVAAAVLHCAVYWLDITQELSKKEGRAKSDRWIVNQLQRHLKTLDLADSPSKAQSATAAFFGVVQTTLSARNLLLRSPAPPEIALLESTAQHHMSRLYAAQVEARQEMEEDWPKLMLIGLADVSMRFLDQLYREVNRQGQRQWKERLAKPDGPFATLKPAELSLLGRRDASMISKYGRKQVETVFEEQLSLVMQSFGFVVARTSRGERRVDLICVSRGQVESSTFLIEAKTSKDPYTLPVADQRALTEYVERARSGLPTLPPLRLVLVVGHSPAPSLEGRLRSLEATAGIPMRFCSTEVLGHLRVSLVGPLDSAKFINAILEGPFVLPDSLAEEIIQSEAEEAEIHADYINKLLGRKPYKSQKQRKSKG